MAVIRRDLWVPTLSRGFWGLVDQAVVSLGTFLLNVLLARHLPIEEFGVYALVLGVLLFLNALHASVVVYPISLKGAAADQAGLRRHAGGALSAIAILASPLWAVAIGATCLAIGRPELIPWALGAAVLWQLQETLRRTFMAQMRHREAVLGDALSYLGQATAMWGLARSGWLSVEAAFGVMALTSTLAAAVQALQLGLGRSMALQGLWAFARHSCYEGRWVLLTSLLMGATMQAFNWTLALVHGLSQVATVEAVGNVLRVTHPVLFSVTGLIVPATARAYRDGGMEQARRIGWTYAAPGAALLLPFFALVLLWPGEALRVFYGPASPYVSLVGLVRLLVLSYALTYVALTLGAILGGVEKSRSAFLAQCTSAATALVVGLPLVVWAGAVGAIAGWAAAVGVRALISGWFVMREDLEKDRAGYEVAQMERDVPAGQV